MRRDLHRVHRARRRTLRHYTAVRDAFNVAHACAFSSRFTFCGITRPLDDHSVCPEKDPVTGKWFNTKAITCITCVAKAGVHEAG